MLFPDDGDWRSDRFNSFVPSFRKVNHQRFITKTKKRYQFVDQCREVHIFAYVDVPRRVFSCEDHCLLSRTTYTLRKQITFNKKKITYHCHWMSTTKKNIYFKEKKKKKQVQLYTCTLSFINSPSVQATKQTNKQTK